MKTTGDISFTGARTVLPILLMAVVTLFGISHQLAAQSGVAISETGSDPHPSAMLEVISGDKGFLLPRMTIEQRDEIAEPAAGLQIVNTTSNCIQVYFPPVWQNVFCGCTTPPDANAGSDQLNQQGTSTQLMANDAGAGNTGTWSIISGDGGLVTNPSNPLSYFTGTPGTSYTLRWTISNPCGSTFDDVEISFESGFSCGETVEFTYRNETVIYETVLSGGGRCWLDRNLGALQVATSHDDFDGFGDYFQWGRLDDGHQLPGSDVVQVTSSTDDPGHGDFITTNDSPRDWRIPQNDALWQGVNGINNPCPQGFRVPTEVEFVIEMLSWEGMNTMGAFNSPLKLTASGYRGGGIQDLGITGWYPSSTTDGELGRFLYYWGTTASMFSDDRFWAGPVRCIKD